MIRIGIDIGGTGVKIGAVDSGRNLIAEHAIPTRTDIPFPEQVRQIWTGVLDTIRKANLTADDIESIGVGIPGIASRKTGEIIKCTNMGWDYVPFREEMRKYTDRPVLIENDANVAALAESIAGISAGTSSSVFITIGTGIGSGIIINGKIWSGYHGIGGELGHVIMRLDGVPCTCGNRGCLERYCAATALIRMAREKVADHPESLILRSVDGDETKIMARTVIDCAREGDPIAVEVYQEYISYLAQAIAGVVNLLDPEVVVLGGGVCNAGDFLLDPIRKEFPKHVIFSDQPLPEIKIAVLGNKAGMIGAAMLS